MSDRQLSYPTQELPTEWMQSALLGWFRVHARDLPWRRTQDPYRIWLSEAMLQQTRVETVIEYYQRFLEKLPTIQDLAQASEAEVLALWSGLGYYRRARALRLAAQQMVREYGGRFPRTRKEALSLPGVGPYSAGAILSIAFDQAEALVDGNVERVFSRFFGLDAQAGSPGLVKECWKLAEQLLPGARHNGDWNQSLMELGALICTPRSPACGDCPLRERCKAWEQGLQEELPRPKQRPEPKAVSLEVLWIREAGAVLLERRPAGGRMGGMWQLPTRQVAPEEPAPLFPMDWSAGLEWAGEEEILQVRHSITRHRICASVLAGRTSMPPGDGFSWLPIGEPASLALTGMTKKVVRRLQAGGISAEESL